MSCTRHNVAHFKCMTFSIIQETVNSISFAIFINVYFKSASWLDTHNPFRHHLYNHSKTRGLWLPCEISHCVDNTELTWRN